MSTGLRKTVSNTKKKDPRAKADAALLPTPAMKHNPDAPLSTLTVKELRNILDKAGVDHSGLKLKKELVAAATKVCAAKRKGTGASQGSINETDRGLCGDCGGCCDDC